MEKKLKWFKEMDGFFISKKKTPKNLKEAFEKTIEKWVLKVSELSFNEDNRKSCGLCNLFLIREKTCAGCPVYTETMVPFCEGSPYSEYCNAKSDKERKIYKEKELNFLLKLQEKYVKDENKNTGN